MYSHINRDQRVALGALLRAGHSQKEAARQIGVHPSSVCRELQRNCRRDGVYFFWWADADAGKRRKTSKQGCRKIDNDPVLRKRIEASLHPLRSPEVIAHEVGITHETIYAWIDRCRPDLKKLLPYQGRKRRRYGTKRQTKQGWTKLVRPIDDRPVEADERSRVGHFEGDTLRGKRGALLTHTDRRSRFEIVHKLPNEGADCAHAAVVGDPHLQDARSITYDRGSTFALWKMIERDTRALVFFAGAHHPWERGTNENENGRLMRIFPKGTNFGIITDKELSETVWLINHTKRKCLNWRTPCDVFGKCCASN